MLGSVFLLKDNVEEVGDAKTLSRSFVFEDADAKGWL